MPIIAECPREDDLRRFVAGDVTLDKFDTLAEHVQLCTECLAKVQTLSPHDPLAQALSKARILPEEPEREIVSQLIDQLKLMPANLSRDGTIRCDVPEQLDEATDFLAPPLALDEIGRLGPYRVLKVLGRGGMGVVFRAEDPDLKRIVALKAMLPILAVSSTAKKRFLREAQTAASIKHDHIVTIHQVGEDRGVPYLAMEFLQGEPLDERLKRETKLPVAEVVRIGRQIAEGLAAAHDNGLIHRDIKPANIWLETLGRQKAASRVKILDFGLARSANDASGLTGVGAIVGTPSYMAPEQATGKSVDGRADLFSFGCVLYAMATGQPPFRGADAISTITAVCSSEAVSPRSLDGDIPAVLSEMIMKLIAKNPADRPASADAVAAELQAMEGIRTGTPAARGGSPDTRSIDAGSRSFATAPTLQRTPPSRRWPIVAGLAGLMAIVALGVVFLLPTPSGTIRVEVNDDDIEVVLTKTGAKIKGANKEHDVVVAPGEHGVKVKRGDLEFETESFVLKKGDTVTVKVDFLEDELQAAANGKVIGAKRAAGESRFALRFDQIVVQDAPILKIPRLTLPRTGPLTLEGYVNVLDPHDYGHNPQYFGTTYQFWFSRGMFRWEPQREVPKAVDEVIWPNVEFPEAKPKTWRHLAAVREGKDIRVYVDGMLAGTKAETRPLWFGDHVEFAIGTMVHGTAFKEVRVSKSARYSANFTPKKRFTSDKDTLALFHLDEGEGDVVKDSSGNGYDAPLTGTFATWMRTDEPFERLHIPINTTWKPNPEQQAYFDAIERMPIKDKIESVVRKLREINQTLERPEVVAVFEPFEGSPTRCQINERHSYLLWPLAALPTLEKVDVSNTSVIDFTPLTKLPLVEIKLPLTIDNVAAEKALRSMVTLRTINDQPAAKVWKDRAAVRKEIDDMTKANLSLSLEDRMAWFGAMMKRLNPNCTATFVGGRAPEPNQMGLWVDGALTRFSARAIENDVFDISPVRALGAESVHLAAGKFYDFTTLSRMKLKEFSLVHNDLARDLSPIAASPLVHLDIMTSLVIDLRPISGMKLDSLDCRFTKVDDLTPIKDMPLKELRVDFVPARDAAVLRSLKSIETINGKPAKEVIDTLP